MARIDADKENRPPRGAHSDRKSKGAVAGGTPGRPKRKGNEYWDIGKVGRKTGITLEDKGIRDEHGLEPMEHIFSSPVKGADEEEERRESPRDVDRTLNSRKTPRLPPPRASTPKHTNIGSPKRMSTGRASTHRLSATAEQNASPTRSRAQPPPNRVLDFGADTVHKSIESPSPFKPRHTLRRSVGVGRENPFASPEKDAKPVVIPEVAEDEVNQIIDDAPIMLDDDNFYDAMPNQPSLEAEDGAQAGAEDESVLERKAGKRKSGDSMNSGKKRSRSALEDGQVDGDSNLSHSQISESGRASKKARGKGSKNNSLLIHEDNGDAAIDPALLAEGDSYQAQIDDEPAPQPTKKSKGKGKAKEKKPKLAPKDPNRAGSKVQLNDSPSKLRSDRSRSQSLGPMNSYVLRATTPAEDSGARTSRFGRNLIQPFKYWANEGRLYKDGVVKGIVRAEEVDVPKKPGHRKGGSKKRRAAGPSGDLGTIEEGVESDTESVLPDEWEDNVFVINGMVASWDEEAQVGVPEELVQEDLGFSAPSIITKDVANAEFKYAKILTLPFFGSGVVEIPPGGFKRAKNSRKMQMCFFVHEGKVLVEVGAAGAGTDGKGGESNQFAISKGGVWVVPRGNNYAITNESTTRTAKLFFAQGCYAAPPSASTSQETSS